MHAFLPRLKFKRAAAAAVTFCALLGNGLAHGADQPVPTSTVIRNTTVIDGTGRDPLEGVDILLKDGKISAIGTDLEVPPETEVMEGAGKYVIPGLIDAHVHLQFPIVFQLTPEEKKAVVEQTPRAFLYNGVTTVLNVGSPLEWIIEQRQAQREGRLLAPRIYALGDSFTPISGWGSRHGGGLRDPAAAREKALNHVAHGVDGFKLIIDDGLGSMGTHVEIPNDMLNAIVEVARANDVPMYAHAINLHEYHRAADIKVKGIMHGLEDPIPEGDTIIQKILDNDITVVPTVSLFESFLAPDPRAGFELADPVLEASVPTFLVENMRRKEFMDEEKRLFNRASHMNTYAWVRHAIPIFRENVTRMHEAGVRFAVGTDAGGTVGYNFQGYETPWEMKIYVEAGMTPMEALVAATRNGAIVIGAEDRIGTLEPGKSADLLILSANPLEDIENVRQIDWVFLEGKAYPREQLAYKAP